MSGTSLDGIDVAIVDIRRGRIQPLAFRGIPYPKAVRAALLGVSNTMTHTATISRLNFLLGELYAEAIRETCRRSRGLAISSRPTVTRNSPMNSTAIATIGGTHHHHQPLMIAAL